MGDEPPPLWAKQSTALCPTPHDSPTVRFDKTLGHRHTDLWVKLSLAYPTVCEHPSRKRTARFVITVAPCNHVTPCESRTKILLKHLSDLYPVPHRKQAPHSTGGDVSLYLYALTDYDRMSDVVPM